MKPAVIGKSLPDVRVAGQAFELSLSRSRQVTACAVCRPVQCVMGFRQRPRRELAPRRNRRAQQNENATAPQFQHRGQLAGQVHADGHAFQNRSPCFAPCASPRARHPAARTRSPGVANCRNPTVQVSRKSQSHQRRRVALGLPYEVPSSIETAVGPKVTSDASPIAGCPVLPAARWCAIARHYRVFSISRAQL